MKKFIYIGENQSIADCLSSNKEINFVHVNNVVGFHNIIESLISVDLILCEENSKGINAVGIYSRYKRLFEKFEIPFVVRKYDMTHSEKLDFLKLGIAEVLLFNQDPCSLVDRIDFIKRMQVSRLHKFEENAISKYKLPFAKRAFDLFVGGIALIIFLPIIIAAAIAIKFESKGSVFYISKRVGTGYRVFDFFKLRTMYADADKRLKEFQHLNQYQDNTASADIESIPKGLLSDSPTLIYKDGTEMSEEEYLELKKMQQAGTFIKFKDDPRVTKVGAFLRNTSIDELPQIFNVIKGDMSIVGNRPIPLYEAEQLTSDDWGQRFLAPAGITGLWQVEKRGKGSMSEEERKSLDNKYAQGFSFWNDIKLILKTVPALFQKENV